MFLENLIEQFNSLNNKALSALEKGRYEEGIKFAEQAREIGKVAFGTNNHNYAASLNNLAGLYESMGRFSEAEPLCLEAMEISKRQLGENHPHYATSLNNLASLYRAMGRFSEAEPLYLEAREIYKRQLGENHPSYAASLNNLAELYRAMGRFSDAEPLYLEAREIDKRQLGENHPSYAASLNNLAGLMATMNRPRKALQLMQEAADIQNRIIGEILSISSDRQRLDYLQQNYWLLEQFLSLINQYFSDDSPAKQAALDLVWRRKGLATEAGILLRTSIASERYRHLAPQFEELRQLTRQIGYLIWQSPASPEGLPEYRQRLADLTRKQEELEQSLSRQIPEMNLESQLKRASRQAIAALLPDGATLVEFVRFSVYNFQAVKANGDSQWLPPRYLAFILSSGDSENVEMLDLGEAETIDNLSRQFRRLASGEDSDTRGKNRDLGFDDDETPEAESWIYPEQGRQLYQILIQPLQRHLQPGQVVYLATDGELATLPFGILSRDGTAELMGEYELRYLNVGRDLLRFHVEIPVEHTQPLVIANPDYNLREYVPVPTPQTRPQKRSTRIPHQTILAVAIAFFVIISVILLAAFPPVGAVLILAGVIAVFAIDGKKPMQTDAPQTVPSPAVLESPLPPFPTPSTPADVRSLSRELGRGEGDIFTPLPGTKIEGERIAQLLQVPVYLETQAVKSLLSHSRSPKIVHIATHGYFLEVSRESLNDAMDGFQFSSIGSSQSRFKFAHVQNPLTRSGLAFAGANTALKEEKLPLDAEEGLLTAQNATMLDLTGTIIVVLSACDTALGNVSIGEGVLGLRRSIIVAGAETLVMSLWKVPDVPTAILMERFYHNLFQNKLGRTKCLEEAQAYLRTLKVAEMRDSWLRAEAIGKVSVSSPASGVFLRDLSRKPDDFMPFQSPSYWAAFISIGNPGVVKSWI
ncbi:CHAT domain-containing tetratricopeptide repeat protein [Lyngbya sp. CCY1209]|uniref:CHAT domain-containing protein n=1 Tax=Lyngbya sp. CCY1209 TaxID=2886103 RepID=UPI002D2029C2|nr:CHAT domain-containing tetratricopeptide repeat protein [Lyngbya sp. CCY1209]MEB3885622.1 CHAT domain-containing protein [Lyngbya sp. CCY1209]